MPSSSATAQRPNGLDHCVTWRSGLRFAAALVTISLTVAGFVLSYAIGRADRVETRIERRLDKIERKIDRLNQTTDRA